MSRITRAAELAKKVLGTDRNLRNQEIKMNRMLPGRAQNISEQVLGKSRLGGLTAPSIALGRNIPGSYKNIAETVLKTPSPRPGGLVDAARSVARSDAVGRGAGATILGGGVFALSQTDPNDLGREMARMNMTLQEGFDTVRQKASDLAAAPQLYFMQVEQAYKDEMQRQQEMQNIQEFGTFEEPEFIPESGEIKPVSLFMAQGGPADSGRTISNMDRAIAAGMGSPMYDDNEPRFETRSPENQMFSIDTAIGNLMTEYDMVVRNKEFERAQMIADQIDQLQQQKIGIQAQNVPQTGFLSNINTNIREMLGESGRTISNQDKETISNLLDSISE